MKTETIAACARCLGTGFCVAVAGLFLGGFLGTLCVDWYRISSFEGGSGYFVLLFALLGAIIGFFVGLVAGIIASKASRLRFLKGLGIGLGSACALTGVITALCWVFADHAPTIDGRELVLDVELRTPEGAAQPAAQEFFKPSLGLLRSGASKSAGYGQFDLEASKRELERWIVPGQCSLVTSTGGRSIWVAWNTNESLYFSIPLPGRPGKGDMEWCEWRNASAVLRDLKWTNAPPGSFAVRYRVQFEKPAQIASGQ